MVEVILRRDVADLGRAGEKVRVRPGYARNYLIPQGIALAATVGNLRRFEHERRRVEEDAARAREAAAERAAVIEACRLSFSRRAGEGGRLFGSVTAADIHAALEGEGISVARRGILLEEPIKRLGEHEVTVRVHAEVDAPLRVTVAGEE